MIKKFLVLTISMFLFSTGYVFAGAGHDHGESKGSMKGSMKMESFSKDVIEVGNKICPVSKEEIGSMGKPFRYEYKGKIYNLCCKMCLKDFKKNPEKFSKIAEKEAKGNNHEKGSSHSDESSEHNHSGRNH